MINPTESFASVLRAAAAVDENQSNNSNQSNPTNPDLVLGENGCPEYTLDALGDARLAMFSKFVRDVPTEKIDEYVSKAMEQADAQLSEEARRLYIRDLFVMMFEKRDCRGGEGEKTIFYHLFWRLAVEFTHFACPMLELFADYGYWNDVFNLVNYIRVYNKSCEQKNDELNLDSDSDQEQDQDQDQVPFLARYNFVTGRMGKRHQMFKLRNRTKTLTVPIETIKDFTDKMIAVVKIQWDEDIKGMEEKKSISLLAKWLPSERSEFSKHNYVVWKRLLKALDVANEREYRIKTVEMREYLDVVERKMCEGRWAEIDPKKVPSCATKNYRKAFLNVLTQAQAEKLGRSPALLDGEEVTGNRYPDREDRVKARARWLEAISKGKVKGAQLSPDMLVQAVESATTEDEKALINAQWVSLRESVQAKITKAREEGFEPMDNIVPMVDLSGSMMGTPMLAAIGLGIMLSELNSGACRDLLITFDSSCHFVDLSRFTTFSEKVWRIRQIPSGLSTNFHLAMERVCELVRKHRLAEDAIPALCILSDEQFDHHQFGYNETMEDRMSRMFHDVGMEISGTPYSKPRTVHWNLRGNTQGFPALPSSANVQMLAGYSPALFDLILCGKPEPTPFETMRRKLDSARYQPVRDAFDSVVV